MQKNFTIILLLIYSLNSFSQESKPNELKSAIFNKDKNLVCELLKKGSNPNSVDTSGTPMIYYAAQTGDVELFKCFVDAKANFNVKAILWADSTRSYYYGNLLCIAAGYGHFELTKYLVEELNIDVSQPEMSLADSSFSGWSPLIWAAYYGNTKVIKYLVLQGAELNYFSKSDSSTALMYALTNFNDTTVKLLINRGADVNLCSVGGLSLLHFSARDDLYEITKILIEKGIDVNLHSNLGYTPLILAAYNGNIEIIELLMEKGADKTLKDKNNKNAIDYANENNHPDIVSYLNNPVEFYNSLDWLDVNKRLLRKNRDGDYKSAMNFAHLALKKAQENPGESSYNLRIALGNIAHMYEMNQNHDSSEYYYLVLQKLIVDIFDKNSKEYIEILGYLCDLYEKSGKFHERIKLLEESCKITEKIYGKKHTEYLMQLNSLAIAYEEIEEIEKSEKMLLESLDLSKNTFGEKHIFYAKAMGNLGGFYMREGKYSLAEKYDTLAIPIFLDSLGKYSFNYLNSLFRLANLYVKMAKFNEAEQLFLTIIDLIEATSFMEKPFYATIIYGYALLNFDRGLYSKADSLVSIALKLREKFLGKDHPDYCYALSTYGLIKFKMGEYIESKIIFSEYLLIIDKIRGKNHSDYAMGLSNLALNEKALSQYEAAIKHTDEAIEIYRQKMPQSIIDLYITLANKGMYLQEKGDYKSAEKCYLESLQLRLKVVDENHPDFGFVNQYLGSLYSDMGDYKKAEEYFLLSEKILRKALGNEHSSLAINLNLIGGFYLDLGNYKKAENYYIESANIRKKIFGPWHPSYAESLNNLALLYSKVYYYDEAIELNMKCIKIRKHNGHTNSSAYSLTLTNLASVYRNTGRIDTAIVLLKESLKITKDVFSDEHPNYSLALNNLGNLYCDIGKYEDALDLYNKALEINIKIFGENHHDNFINYSNLGTVYNLMNKPEECWRNYSKSNTLINQQISSVFSFLSENEKEKFLKKIEANYEIYYSINYKFRKELPEMEIAAYNNALSYKGLLLQSGTMLRQSILNSNDDELISLYDSFTKNKKLISELYSQAENNRKHDVDSLEQLLALQEKEMSRKSENLSFMLKNLKFKFEDVKERLSDDETAIEFIHFQYNDTCWTDSIMYCALLIRKDFKYPKMVYLFNKKDLENLIGEKASLSASPYVSWLYGTKLKQSQNMFTDSAKYKTELYDLIWAPIEPYLKGINKVYYSPTGLLHKIAFDAIQTNDTVYLSDKYSMNYMSSTRNLCYDKKSFKLIQDIKLYLFGGIEYNLDSTTMTSTALEQRGITDISTSTARNVSFVTDSTRGGEFSFLSGTVEEVDSINSMFEKKSIPTKTNMSLFATEESFKMLSGLKEPNIAHIATHGFFSPDPKQLSISEKEDATRNAGNENSAARAFTQAKNPLFRSGLIFAGANRVWKGERPIQGIDDGILTAYEISNLNLSNTKLVVMSACETGLGDIKGSEGVYGLQRSFKMAGVDYIIMSLWEVPDYHTSKLMQLFYDNWLKGMDIREAFRTAQNEMRQKYDPYYWAAFVLIE
ncbi:MAG: tetratricopeptide repeat protein [Saprospiraceae bacterium]|nr:tetratricopeptide repeat protein [Saprospiraceae bacterium]